MKNEAKHPPSGRVSRFIPNHRRENVAKILKDDQTAGGDAFVILSFVKEKETPGAVRYQEVNSDGVPLKNDMSGAHVGTLYIRKWCLNGKIPNKLRVAFTAE